MTVMMTVKMILMPVKMIVITVMVKMAQYVETSLLLKDTPVLDSNSGITFGGTFLYYSLKL